MTADGNSGIEGDGGSERPWPEWMFRALSVAMGLAWAGFLWLAVITLVNGARLALPDAEVVCRMPSGQVMLFRPGGGPKVADPSSYRFSSYVLGKDERPRAGQVEASTLDCDPRKIAPRELAALDSADVTSLALSTKMEAGAVRAELKVRRSTSGTDTYRWTWRDGKIEATPGQGERRSQGLVFCLFWLLVSLAPTLALLQQLRLRRRLASAPTSTNGSEASEGPAGGGGGRAG